MSGSHEKLPWLFWAQLVLVAIVGTLYLLAPSSKKYDTEASETSQVVKEAQSNLKPVGTIATKSEQTGSSESTAKSGDQVYNEACAACHNNGIANAPKPDDKAAWEPRIAQGLDGLIKTAINGKGAMPPRGGNPAVTDAEIKAAILYMTEKAGFKLVDAGSTETTAPEPKATDAAKPSAETMNASGVVNAETSKIADTEQANNAPVEPDSAPAPQEPASRSAPTAPAPPVPPAPVMSQQAPSAPAIPSNTSENAVETVAMGISTPEAPIEPTAPVVEKTPLQPLQEKQTDKPEEPTVTTTNSPSAVSLEEGKKVYNSTCFSCHAAGVAGAPKLEDKALWEPRLAAGIDAMYNAAINGKGIMPPKGGNMSLSDDVVKAAVDYMISQVK